MSIAARAACPRPVAPLALIGLAMALVSPVPPSGSALAVAGALPDHLVISEVATGGASASDELIELYNPTASALPLEGLELVYVTASGATISKRAEWGIGAPEVPGGGHVLVTHQDGAFAPIADATYAAGIAATGGSVALRIAGAASAIDAVGWGSAASSWLEGQPAPPPATGSSIERLPGGAAGSTQDTDDNAADFTDRDIPDPQNLASPPTPDPEAPPPTIAPTPVPTAEPTPAMEVTPIAAARSLPDGTVVTVEGVSLTSSAFHDGGGFVVDATGGIAVLVDGGAFARGERLRISGEIDDRFSQRTLRADATSIIDLGPGAPPLPAARPTAEVGEAVEGRLVRVAGTIAGSGTALTTGRAFDLDDGSGAVRVIVGFATGIDVSAWVAGTEVDLVGVAGQRDSTGAGTTGYRILPRDVADVLGVVPPTSPFPSASAVPTASGSAVPEPGSVITIAAARAAAKNASVSVEGVVTLPDGAADTQTAVIQDATGAIVLRLSGAPGALRRGERVRATGVRSTKSGMETIRVSTPVVRLGTADLPEPLVLRTGEADERHEALLVVVRGSIDASPRRASSGSVTFDVDDGSGSLKVSLGRGLAADSSAWSAGDWIEAIGVLGQETTGAAPTDGYRVWPSSSAGVRTLVAASGGTAAAAGDGDDTFAATESLDEIGAADLSELRVGATLVTGPWPELAIGGLLWDGSRLVAIDAASAARVEELLDGRSVPLAVELSGLRATGVEPLTGIARVRLGDAPDATLPGVAPPAAPRAGIGSTPAWVAAVGRLTGAGGSTRLALGAEQVPVEVHCDRREASGAGKVGVTGIAVGEPVRLIVPCGGIRAAPILARSAAETTAGDSRPGSEPLRHGAADVPVPRVLGAVLLAASALLLMAVTVHRRLREEGSSGDDQRTEAPGEDAVPDEPPRLTLVPREREHRS